MALTNLSIREVAAGLQTRDFSVVELVECYLKSISQHELQVKAFLKVTPEVALEQAKKVDSKIAHGESLGKLAGVPLAVKDVFATQGIETTAGSKILEHYKPPFNATAVERVLNEDAVVLGKTNCDEFAMGSSGENSAYGATHNPWNFEKAPGGSSSGSATAVAAGESLASLGTDTGGSIRQPAAFCGVVGLKPTYSRVSRYGLIAMASSLDQAGPFAHSVEDAAYILEAIAGRDERDATSSELVVSPYVAELGKSVKGLRVGVPKEFFGTGMENGVADEVRAAIKKLADLGCLVEEVSLPSMPYALASYYVLNPAEVSANLARYDGMRYGQKAEGRRLYEVYTNTRGKFLGREAKRRIMLGTYVLSAGYYDAYYKQAKKVQNIIKADFASVFEKVDILATATSPTVAFDLGSRSNDPLAMYLADINTVPVNIAGLPAISVPCGLSAGLPVGLQLIGRAFEESTIFRLAHAYEEIRGKFNLPFNGEE